MTNRRNFIKQIMGASSLVLGSKILSSYTKVDNAFAQHEDGENFATPHAMKGMPIKATFLDEISWDIPHQNWGKKEWDQDFKAMK